MASVMRASLSSSTCALAAADAMLTVWFASDTRAWLLALGLATHYTQWICLDGLGVSDVVTSGSSYPDTPS